MLLLPWQTNALQSNPAAALLMVVACALQAQQVSSGRVPDQLLSLEQHVPGPQQYTQVVHLLQLMLQPEPQSRLTVSQALAHSFFA